MAVPRLDCHGTPLPAITCDFTPTSTSQLVTYLPPPHISPLESILPDEPLLMMGAGPVPIPHRVAYANSIVINHLGETMSKVIEQVKNMGRYVFQTASPHVLGVAGPGSAAMEMAITNLVAPGTTVLSVTNGFFSQRMAEMARRVGGHVDVLPVEDNASARPALVEARLRTRKYDVLTIVQGETSNTVFNRELQEIARLAKAHGCLVIVDAVCTLSTMPLEMDDWQIDAVITGGQKGLSSIPGVSLLAFSRSAWEAIERATGHPAALVSGREAGGQVLEPELLPLHRAGVGHPRAARGTPPGL